jgi:hypothetical protein
LLGEIGFIAAEVRERFDPFLGTSKERVTRKFQVTGVNVRSAKPLGSKSTASRV